MKATHHVLLAHGKAVQVIRSRTKTPAQVGVAQVGVIAVPENNTPENINTARAATWSITEKNTWSNR